MKSNTRKLLLAGIGLVLLLVILIELIANWKVLRLPEEQKGTYPLPYTSVTTENMVLTPDGYQVVEGAEEASITWTIDRSYIDKLQYDINCVYLFNASVTMEGENMYGDPTSRTVVDNSPILVPRSTVNLKGYAVALTLKLTDILVSPEELAKPTHVQGSKIPIVGNPMIVNHPFINWYRVVTVFLLGMMVVLLFVFRSLFLDKLEFGFALVAFTVGFTMLLSFPSLKVGWDEEAHFRAAYRLTALVKVDTMPEEIMGHLLAGAYGWPLNPPESLEETRLLDDIQNDIWENDADDLVFEGCTRGFATAGTVFQAAAILVARVFNFSWSGFYFFGRLVNLLTYVIAMFFVIRILPVGKKVTTFISLMPTSIFLAVNYTYDVVVYAFMLLGIAMVLREWFREDRKVSWKWMIAAYLFFMWGAFSKQVYAPLILLTWLIPTERFESRKQAWIIKLLSAGTMVIVLGSMWVATLVGHYGSGDSRGGSEVNSGSQIALILSHPIAYTKLLFKMILSTFYEYIFAGSVFQTMGHLPNAKFGHIIPFAAIGVILADQENTEKFKLWQRVLLFLLCGGVAVLVWTALYVQYNNVGATWIGGVQARYYRPFLPLVYMVFGNRLLTINTTDRRVNGALLSVCSWIMIGTVWQVLTMFRI